MVFKGCEADREALKYIRPARAKQIECPSVADCPKGRQTLARVKLSTDPRIFAPTPRHTLKFDRRYKHRAAVERVNGVLDTVLGFELRTMRGLSMARLRVTLALTAMLAMALGRIRAGQKEHPRSLLKAA